MTTLQQGVLCSSCVVIEGSLFACYNSLHQIVEYNLSSNQWEIASTIYRQITDRSRVKLAVSERDTIIYAGTNPPIICELDVDGSEDTDHIFKDAGRYDLCSVDAKGSILVIDKKNGCLKVFTPRVGWSMLGLKPRVNPQSAIVIKNRVCVASDDSQLLLYTSEVA